MDRDPSERTRPRKELAALRAIDAPVPVRPVEHHAETGAGLVGDGMQREERLAHRPVAPFCEELDGQHAAGAKDSPLLEHEVGERCSTVLEAQDPLLRRLFDRGRPAREATRRPYLPLRRSETQSVGFGPAEDDVSQGEQIGRPREKLVGHGKPRGGLPEGG